MGLWREREKKKRIYPHIVVKRQPKNLLRRHTRKKPWLFLQVNMTKQIGDDKHTHTHTNTRWIPGGDGRIINDAAPSVLFESCQSCDLLNRVVYTVRRFAQFEGWLAAERKKIQPGDEGRIWAESPECKRGERCLHITRHLWGWSWMYCIEKEEVEREHPPTHVHSGELHQRERVCVYCCYLGSFVVCLCTGIHCSWPPPPSLWERTDRGNNTLLSY